MADKPMECPFCGEQPGKDVFTANTSGRRFVLCGNCGARGPGERTKEKAIDAWNMRQGDT